MSNHFSADYLKSPGDDRRLDLTDVFLFKSSKDPSKLVLIMDSNPTVPDPAPNPDRGPEVPTDLFGTGRQIGVWASISRRRDDGTLEQMDRGGNPTINPFINPDGEKDLYNSRQPVDDVDNYLGPWSKVLENGGYPPEEARKAALQFLPDILRYDLTKPIAYPNGRKPIDDAYSYRFAWLSYGKVPRKASNLTPTC